MVERRCQHSVVAFRSNIYVLVGWNGRTYLNTDEMLNTETQQFTRLKPMEISRLSFGATISGDNIYCFGGWRDGFLDSVESFNMITKECKIGKVLPQKVTCLAAVTAYEA